MLSYIILATRIGSTFLGVLLPALIFTLSFILTYLLVRYFTKNNES